MSPAARMRVAELYERRRFRVTEAALSDPGPGEIQARVRAVGICGSDRHYFLEGGIGDTPCVYPMVLGHEPVGEVIKTGPGVSGWGPGDRVALEPAIYCYHCEFCLTGHHNVCASIRFLSTPGEPGFFRERVNLPAANLLPLPPKLSWQEATLFEPLAIILHSMQFVALRPGETVAVFGAGPIGLLTIAVLRMAGASRIFAVEPIPGRRDLALRGGADAVLDPLATDPVKEILQETGGRGVDAAVDCATQAGSINQAIHVARRAGRVVITGIPSEVTVPIHLHAARRKELTLYNVHRSNHDSATALRLLAEQPGRFAPIVTHSRPVEEIQGAFEMLERYEGGPGKVVIEL